MPHLFSSHPAGPFGTYLPDQSVVPEGKISAYRSTRYEVVVECGLDLHVDRPEPWLAALMARYQATTIGVLTAANPSGKLMSPPFNMNLQARLKHKLVDHGHDWLPVFGHDPFGEWPGEEMMLVPGISPKQLIMLGQAAHQDAVLLATETDPVLRLLLLR